MGAFKYKKYNSELLFIDLVIKHVQLFSLVTLIFPDKPVKVCLPALPLDSNSIQSIPSSRYRLVSPLLYPQYHLDSIITSNTIVSLPDDASVRFRIVAPRRVRYRDPLQLTTLDHHRPIPLHVCNQYHPGVLCPHNLSICHTRCCPNPNVCLAWAIAFGCCVT